MTEVGEKLVSWWIGKDEVDWGMVGHEDEKLMDCEHYSGFECEGWSGSWYGWGYSKP